MKKLCALMMAILLVCASCCLADEADGDLYTFAPYMCTAMFNAFMESSWGDAAQAAMYQVSLSEDQGGRYLYSNAAGDLSFVFEGASTELSAGDTVLIRCSLKDSSELKNIPMLLWAGIVEVTYYGDIKQDGTGFLEWVNQNRNDGDSFVSAYFSAVYSQEEGDYCSLLLVRK